MLRRFANIPAVCSACCKVARTATVVVNNASALSLNHFRPFSAFASTPIPMSENVTSAGSLESSAVSSNEIDQRLGPKFSMAHTSYAGRRRFYKTVDVAKVEDRNEYKILLDQRTLKTPAKSNLHLPNLELAAMIALEWDAQQDKRGIQPATMPLMTLATTAIDQVQHDPHYARRTVMRYLHTDTALFFSSDEDRILLKKQKQVFQPIIKWYARTLDIELETTQGMGKLNHPKKTIEKIEKIVNSLDHFALTCLQSVTMECKSLVIALAVVLKHVDIKQAVVASRLEEEFQAEIWGTVEGGHDMDRLNNSTQLHSAGCFLNLHLSHKDVQKIISEVNKQ